MKKKIIFILSFLFCVSAKAQYGSSISYIPNQKTILAQTYGISDNMGAYVGIDQNYVYVNNQNFKPYPFVNRFGLNYAFSENGFNLGGGVKINRNQTTGVDVFLPHVVFTFHPIHLLTQKNGGVDLEFLIESSIDNTNYGIGILIPFWLNRY